VSFDEILDALGEIGIPTESIVDFALYGPLILLVVTFALYFVANRQRRLRLAQERAARGILSGARKRSATLSQDEILARLQPFEEDDQSVTRKSMMSVSEMLLRLVNFDREATRRKLIQAGDRDPKALSRYILQRGSGMLIAPVALWMLAPVLGLAGILKIAVSLIGILAGGILVDARLDRALKVRRSRLQAELPVFLDLLTIYLEAGAAFDVALIRASKALEVSFPTAAAEVYYLRQDLETSIDRERSLRDFAERVDSTIARTFIAIVIQSERRGNAIAPALRTLAREARRQVMESVERRAQKLPTVMQLPMLVFILPAIFMAVIGPAILQVIHEFSNSALGGG